VNTGVTIFTFEEFDAAFGSRGLAVGPRTGPNKRSQDDKEWYVARRFLESAIPAGLFRCPLSIWKEVPPRPDFSVLSNGIDVAIEITEATHEADQREMTKFEYCDESAALLGTFGGRFPDGASEPGWAWASDIVNCNQTQRWKVHLHGGRRNPPFGDLPKLECLVLDIRRGR
jgi:hypothetical protein